MVKANFKIINTSFHKLAMILVSCYSVMSALSVFMKRFDKTLFETIVTEISRKISLNNLLKVVIYFRYFQTHRIEYKVYILFRKIGIRIVKTYHVVITKTYINKDIEIVIDVVSS